MVTFKSISENYQTAEITEKKSRFIAHVFRVETFEEAEEKITIIKKKYHDAKHNCFAYAIETNDGGVAVKYNDDGEPGGTAGSPILKVILGMNLSNTLVVVTRYFGGTLLGTGGLVKAYTEVTQKAIDNATLKEQTRGCEVSIVLEYSEVDKAKYYFSQQQCKIVDIRYLDNIEIIVEISNEKMEKLTNINKNGVFTIINYKILKEKFIDI